jgi:hypothetical protein
MSVHKHEEKQMKPIIFEEYNFNRAETQFPLITTTSSDAEVTETAWRYSIDIMRNDAGLLQDAFIGEYLGDLGFMEEYHQQVLQALADENYEEIGKLVEASVSYLNQITVDYINEHITQMEMRYE